MIHAVRKVARAAAPGQRLPGLQMSFDPGGAVDRDAKLVVTRVAVAERVAGLWRPLKPAHQHVGGLLAPARRERLLESS